jgi:hypothetical protein
MATEKRQLNDLDAVSSVSWTNESNAFVEDDNYASSGAVNINGIAGGDYDDITQTPTGFSTFVCRFYDINADHVNDTFDFEIYDNDSSSWVNCETFNSGNLLPTSLTTKDYTSTVNTEYTAAADKSAFLNSLQFRIRCSAKSGGNDGPEIGLAYSYFEYTYTESAETFFENRHPIEHGMKPQTAAGMNGVLIE